MSGIKALKIGDLVLQRPVIQGGMGVGISLHKLAGAVAASGGMGLISTAQIGFREPDFKTNFVEANLRAIRREMQKAREIAPKGLSVLILWLPPSTMTCGSRKPLNPAQMPLYPAQVFRYVFRNMHRLLTKR